MAVNNVPTDHADHDELRIAAYAAGDLGGPELTIATELVASCPTCAGLADDLALIRAATRRLPIPERTRDFRLTEADAERLRPRGWRRYLTSLAGPRFAFTQPLAAGLATLGLVGVLLATLPAGLGGFSASTGSSNVGGAPETSGDRVAAPPQAQPSGGASAAEQPLSGAPSAAAGVPEASPSLAAPQPAPSQEAGALAPAAPSSPPEGEDAALPADAGTTANKSLTTEMAVGEERADDASVVLIVSLVLIGGGVGLFLLRWSARRLTDV